MNSSIAPKRLALQYHPPVLILEYIDTSTNKTRHLKIFLKKYLPVSPDNDKIQKLSSSIIKNYKNYFHNVSSEQIERLLYKLMENEDLNKLSDEELKKRKEEMDIIFNKNRIKPGDPNYQFDVRKEFTPVEPSGMYIPFTFNLE